MKSRHTVYVNVAVSKMDLIGGYSTCGGMLRKRIGSFLFGSIQQENRREHTCVASRTADSGARGCVPLALHT